METEYLQAQDYELSNLSENIEMIIYSLICFFVPFLMGHPQIAVGIIVNMILVLSALNLRSYKLLPIIALPSLAVYSRGIMFGPYTVYLLYIIPFIWIGNLILVYFMKEHHTRKKKNKWMFLGIGSIIKSSFIFLATYLFAVFNLIPYELLIPMGILQISTALIGGSIALGIHNLKKKYIHKKQI